jgi:malate dehydrogenase (oxaloacetate-decarboxylating)
MVHRSYSLNMKQGEPSYDVSARGSEILSTPSLNKGTAFSFEERESLGLTGLLPPVEESLEQQVARSYEQYNHRPDNLSKHIFLADLHDSNEVVFFRLLDEHIQEMMPVVYTPTVGLAIERYSHTYRRPRGVFLSINHPDKIEESFRNVGAGPDDIDLIVATDSEGILGIGDWGVGGINIAIGKLVVYTVAAGINPMRTLPVVLDVGTNRSSLLNDPLYAGYRHARVRGERYDDFIDAYVQTATRLFPNALLHWEDFGSLNARRILNRYRDTVCTFNDDMQGTGAMVLAAILSAVTVSGTPMRDQRVIVFGAGTAGSGIADQICDAMVRDGLTRDQALRRIWTVDVPGLLTDNMGPSLRPFQLPYARPASESADWPRTGPHDTLCLEDVVGQVLPTMLIGTSTSPHAFTQRLARTMADHCERPIIFPLSNPTRLSEADPSDLIAWTDGRALIATGSPFPPVNHGGLTHTIAQANNALLYPGLGLGAIVSRATRVSDEMLWAAAKAVACCADMTTPGAAVLPHVSEIRATSATVAVEVAKAADAEGLAQVDLSDVIQQVQDTMWYPRYVPFHAV